MDPKRFMSHVLKFPGPCVFFPPMWDLHFLPAGKGNGDNWGTMAGAPTMLGGKVPGCPQSPYTHLVMLQMRRPRGEREWFVHTGRCGLLTPSPVFQQFKDASHH